MGRTKERRGPVRAEPIASQAAAQPREAVLQAMRRPFLGLSEEEVMLLVGVILEPSSK
jgi:hypothetical protein